MEAYDHDDDLDTEIDDTEYEDALRRGDRDRSGRHRCWDAACVHPDPMHTRDECYTAEMMEELMEAFFADADGGEHGHRS